MLPEERRNEGKCASCSELNGGGRVCNGTEMAISFLRMEEDFGKELHIALC